MKLPLLSAQEVIKVLKKLGFEELRQNGVINILNIQMEEQQLFQFIPEEILERVYSRK